MTKIKFQSPGFYTPMDLVPEESAKAPNKPQTVEVRLSWLKGLIEHAKKVETSKPPIGKVPDDQMEFRTNLAILEGYISSAEYLIRSR